MKLFSSLLNGQRVLPIIKADSIKQGVDIARAMADGGIHLVEVVLRTEASLLALEAIKKTFPEMTVGAGTILNKGDLSKALGAGADFIVTPAISEDLLIELSRCPVPVLPGVSNTADILQAREHGFRELKLFPAELSGGVKFIHAMKAVYQDTIFCPTGGISQKNKDDYLRLENCFAVGGTWVVDKSWVENQMWSNISEACALANH